MSESLKTKHRLDIPLRYLAGVACLLMLATATMLRGAENSNRSRAASRVEYKITRCYEAFDYANQKIGGLLGARMELTMTKGLLRKKT